MEIDRVDAGRREGQNHAQQAAGQAGQEEIGHIRQQVQALALRYRRDHRPPEDRRRHQEAEVLYDVDTFVAQGRFVQGRRMPGPERANPQRPGQHRLAEHPLGPARRFPAQRQLGDLGRDAEQQQRRHGQHEQKMLQHVRAEEVRVSQRVQRRHKGQ